VKILKIASNTRNVKLRDIAASVVASVADDPKGPDVRRLIRPAPGAQGSKAPVPA
jgi:hypothetical protein